MVVGDFGRRKVLKAISIELYVTNAAPYRPLMELLGLAERRVTETVTIWEGATTVLLHEGGADLLPSHPFATGLAAGVARGVGTEICLEVEAIEAVAAGVAAMPGFAVVAPLTMQPWGLRDLRVVTPDGYFLRIMDVR